MSSTSPAFTEAGLQKLPAPIVAKLRILINRVRRIALLKGVFAVAATGLICLLAIMAIDASVTLFSASARWLLSLAGLAVTLVALWWWVIRPMTQRITLTSIARYVEERHPELQERISSAVELLASDDPDEIRGSQELIDEVVKSAILDVDKVSPEDEFDTTPIRRYGMAAIAVAGVLVLTLIIWPRPASTLLARAMAPFLEIGNAWANTLTVEPGDIRVAAGENVIITAGIEHPRIERATVRRMEKGASAESVERMTLASIDEAPGVREFSLSFPSVQESFEYRVHIGSALSRSYQVEVVPRPAVEEIQVTYDYPVYTGLPDRTGPLENGQILALENTRVTVKATLSREVESSVLRMNGQSLEAEMITDGEENAQHKWEFTLQRDQQSDWSINVLDEFGIGNEPGIWQLRSVRDRTPSIRIATPEAREMKLRPDEFLPLTIASEEDFGFTATEIVARLDEGDPISLPREFPKRSAGTSWGATLPLELASLDLEGVRTVRVQVRVADNLPEEFEGAQVAWSDEVVIHLDQRADSLVEQTFDAQEERIRKEVEQTKRDLKTARDRQVESERRMQKEKELDASAMEDLDEARTKLTDAENRMQKLAEEIEDTVFDKRAEDLKRIAEDSVKPARESTETIPLQDENEKRIAESKEAVENIDQAMEDLDQLMEDLQENKKQAEMVAELSDMANKQRELAEQAERQAKAEAQQQMETASLDPEDQEAKRQAEEARKEQKKELDELRRSQDRMQQELAEMIRENPEALQEVLQEQQAKAEELAQEAQELAEEQRELRETTRLAQNADQAEKLKQELMERLQDEQAQIATETEELRQKMAESSPQEAQESASNSMEEALASAAQETQQAAENLEKGKAEEAGQTAAEAAESLQHAAEEATRSASEATSESAEQRMAEASEGAQKPTSEEDQPEGQESSEQGQPQMAEASESGNPQQASSQDSASPEGESQSPQGPSASEMQQMAQQMRELQQRQEAVAEELGAIQGGQLEEALASMQESLAQEAQELAQQADAVEDSAAATQQQAPRQQASRAEQQFKQAASTSQQASNALEQAQRSQDASQQQAAQAAAQEAGMSSGEAKAQAQAMAQSGETPAAQPSNTERNQLNQSYQQQSRTEQALKQASQALSHAAQQMANQSKNLARQEANPGNVLDPSDMAESFQQVSSAAEAQSASEVAPSASQAAQFLQQMAQQAARQMGASSDYAPMAGGPSQPPAETGQPGEGMPGQAQSEQAAANEQAGARASAEGVPPALEELGLSVDDWARMQGGLEAGATGSTSSGAPGEYQGLVNDYFRIIAREAAREP